MYSDSESSGEAEKLASSPISCIESSIFKLGQVMSCDRRNNGRLSHKKKVPHLLCPLKHEL